MQATTQLLRSFGSYKPDTERRGRLAMDTPGLERIRDIVRAKAIAHDLEFAQPRAGFHAARLLWHLEDDEALTEIVARKVGFSEEEIFTSRMIAFCHDFSKTVWHGHRYDGPLPAEEYVGKEGHARLSGLMLVELARELEIGPEDWPTVQSVAIGLKYHHHPERLAAIAERVRRQREVKQTTLVHVVDCYVGIREHRGNSHPGIDHVAALAETLVHIRKPRFDYAREGVQAIWAALTSREVESYPLQTRE